MSTKNPSSLSKHLVRRDLERDPDHINQMLWKRKIYKKRVERNELKKVRKHYFKEKEGGLEGAAEKEGLPAVDAKKDEFYKQLFSKAEGEDEEIDARRQRRPKKAREQVKPSAEKASTAAGEKEEEKQEEVPLKKEVPEKVA
jgi:hypothetical protein